MNNYDYKSFKIGSNYQLDDLHLKTLSGMFQQPCQPCSAVLGGRSAVIQVFLHGIGSVVVKQYTRGGLLRHVLKRYYLRTGKMRCEQEYDFTYLLHTLGINIPEPIAFASKGRLFYQAWLITREIPNVLPLSKLEPQVNSHFEDIMDSFVNQVSSLVENFIFHPDLHPGNALVDSSNRVFLLDFDKANVYQGSKQRLAQKYLQRWQRAVLKHGLDQSLEISFRKKFEIPKRSLKSIAKEARDKKN